MDSIFTKLQLIAAFRAQAASMCSLLSDIPADVFSTGSIADWSPAHHVEHLINVATRICAGVTNQSALPARDLTLSRGFVEMRETYLETLAQVPAETLRNFGTRAQLAAADADVQRKTHSIARLDSALTSLADALAAWSESDLDAYGMAHPILGVLSVREMLLFALYHNTHHERGIRRITAT